MIMITSTSNTLLTRSLNMSLSSNQYLTNHYRKKTLKSELNTSGQNQRRLTQNRDTTFTHSSMWFHISTY